MAEACNQILFLSIKWLPAMWSYFYYICCIILVVLLIASCLKRMWKSYWLFLWHDIAVNLNKFLNDHLFQLVPIQQPNKNICCLISINVSIKSWLFGALIRLKAVVKVEGHFQKTKGLSPKTCKISNHMTYGLYWILWK